MNCFLYFYIYGESYFLKNSDIIIDDCMVLYKVELLSFLNGNYSCVNVRSFILVNILDFLLKK